MEQSMLNAPIINQEEAMQVVRNMVKRELNRPIMFLGKGGIGKSQMIEQVAEELSMGYVDIRLLLYTESDLKGIPYVNENHTATVWLQNNILPSIEKDGERGILVFDEITSCAKSLRTAAYQLLNERRLGEYVLPDGWYMVCLGNGENDGGQYNGMEGNFANRCSVYEVHADTQSWKKWALRNNVNPLVISYISWQNADIHTMDIDKEEEIVFASPRSWKAVSDTLNTTEFDSNDRILRLEIESNIGKLIGGQFFAFCKYKDVVIEPAEILDGKATSYPDDVEVIFLTIQSLVKLMADNIKQYIDNGGDVEKIADDKEISNKCLNGIKWILGLKQLEYKTMAIKDFIAINQEVIASIVLNPSFLKQCKELLDFTKKNAVIFSEL